MLAATRDKHTGVMFAMKIYMHSNDKRNKQVRFKQKVAINTLRNVLGMTGMLKLPCLNGVEHYECDVMLDEVCFGFPYKFMKEEIDLEVRYVASLVQTTDIVNRNIAEHELNDNWFRTMFEIHQTLGEKHDKRILLLMLFYAACNPAKYETEFSRRCFSLMKRKFKVRFRDLVNVMPSTQIWLDNEGLKPWDDTGQ